MNSKKKKIILLIIFLPIFLLSFVDSINALQPPIHNTINTHVAKSTFYGFSLDDYLKKQLGMQKGYDEQLNSKKVHEWISYGGETEDKPGWCIPYWRSRNHFHNPIDNSGFSGWWDTGFLSGMAVINWALQPPNSQTCGYYSWNDARTYYFSALTAPDKATRETNFAKTFRALGQVMHLVQDMSVPEHTRNDGHYFGYDYEKWVDKPVNRATINTYDPTSIKSFTPNSSYPLSVTNLFDTEQYNGANPGITVQSSAIGLSEYSNANFLSQDNIFTNFAYPAYADMTDNVDKESGKDILYLTKSNAHGEAIAHFARANNFYKYLPAGFKRLALTLNDDKVYTDYSQKLIPRAIGYSSQVLSYFFRGSIEISLPAKGTYALTKDPEQGFFTSITLLAKNNSPEGEEMSDGSIFLVIKYKLALGDPFANYGYPVPTSPEFFYLVFPVANNVRSIPRSPLELTFDLGDHPLSHWATDVYLQVVYKGQLGSEADAIAVGFRDICEPTPVDIINSMDKICLYSNWYDAGSLGAIALVDSNNNGIAGINEWDVYPHDLVDIFFTFLPSGDLHYPSCTQDDIYFERLPAGEYRRMFILSDYNYCYSFCAIPVFPTNPDDIWVSTFPPEIYCTRGIKNQTESTDSSEDCLLNGVNPPCYIRYYPAFTTINRIDYWTGMNFRNSAFPQDSSCPTE